MAAAPRAPTVPIIFYDRNGVAVAHSEDERHLYLFTGQAVAYLEAGALYSYPGHLMGWFKEGWLRDRDGRCVAYAARAIGGPVHPPAKALPVQSAKKPQPVELLRDKLTLRPIQSDAWSDQTALDFLLKKALPWPGEIAGVADRRLDRRRHRERRGPEDPRL